VSHMRIPTLRRLVRLDADAPACIAQAPAALATKPGARPLATIPLADLTGTGVHGTAIANLAAARALSAGAGRAIDKVESGGSA
jgi:hypothetical protein